MPKFAAIAMVPFTKSYPTPLQLLNFKSDLATKAGLNERQRAATGKAIDVVFGEYLIIRMNREIYEKTFDTKEKAQRLCADIWKAEAYIKLLETIPDINLNREL